MNPNRRAILIVGSPKTGRSASLAVGTYLVDRLSSLGFLGETVHAHRTVRSASLTSALVSRVNEAELVVLSSPLYVDSLPAPVIRLFELVAEGREASRPRRPAFAALVNSGFPEPHQNGTAIEVCRLFARDAGLSWAGGLPIGGGGAFGAGKPLEQAGGIATRLRKALDLTAEALADGREVPSAATDLLSHPTMPPSLYRLLGSLGMRWMAWRNGASSRLGARPYPNA